MKRTVKWTCRHCRHQGTERLWFWQKAPLLCDTRSACDERFYQQDPVLQLAITMLDSPSQIMKLLELAGLAATRDEMNTTYRYTDKGGIEEVRGNTVHLRAWPVYEFPSEKQHA